MSRVSITQLGKESYSSERMFRRYVLGALLKYPYLSIYNLVLYVRKNHQEYKYTRPELLTIQLDEMRKAELIEIKLGGE